MVVRVTSQHVRDKQRSNRVNVIKHDFSSDDRNTAMPVSTLRLMLGTRRCLCPSTAAHFRSVFFSLLFTALLVAFRFGLLSHARCFLFAMAVEEKNKQNTTRLDYETISPGTLFKHKRSQDKSRTRFKSRFVSRKLNSGSPAFHSTMGLQISPAAFDLMARVWSYGR